MAQNFTAECQAAIGKSNTPTDLTRWGFSQLTLGKHIMEYKDTIGREIEVGDRIVYPGRQGGGLWMNEGVVVAKTVSKNNGYGYCGKDTPVLKVERKPDNDRVWDSKLGKYVDRDPNERMIVTLFNINLCTIVPK